MKNLIQRFIRNEEGQDLIEYALLAALLAIVSIIVLTALGPRISQVFSNVQSALPAAT